MAFNWILTEAELQNKVTMIAFLLPSIILILLRGLPLIRRKKIPWLFPDFWTIFTDLKLPRWMIKKRWKPLMKTTIVTNITWINHFSWCFSDKRCYSLTFHWLLQTSKIFPGLLQNSLTFPWLWQPCYTNRTQKQIKIKGIEIYQHSQQMWPFEPVKWISK